MAGERGRIKLRHSNQLLRCLCDGLSMILCEKKGGIDGLPFHVLTKAGPQKQVDP